MARPLSASGIQHDRTATTRLAIFMRHRRSPRCGGGATRARMPLRPEVWPDRHARGLRAFRQTPRSAARTTTHWQPHGSIKAPPGRHYDVRCSWQPWETALTEAGPASAPHDIGRPAVPTPVPTLGAGEREGVKIAGKELVLVRPL